MNILLVEDEALLGETLKELLETLGHQVFYTKDAMEAQEILSARGMEIDFALVDVVLPGMSGPELVVWILERYPHIRVVCITGYTPLVTEEPCGKGVPVIFKPFTIKDLEPYLKVH
ncbi:response regulator [Thermosulfurimonas dismutans]|uniref:Two-component hybrid sensor and regulator n=1 Tax=Thermosulfurimonas dismutans TaxID=999894 RepID=A0A179D5W4_9BACT|nr:response regulator [Thermosulfurimonas dismutans]OAQ21119.1 two-component hybrid sensor and regulator [Thermosulfurimonas dismutans]